MRKSVSGFIGRSGIGATWPSTHVLAKGRIPPLLSHLTFATGTALDAPFRSLPRASFTIIASRPLLSGKGAATPNPQSTYHGKRGRLSAGQLPLASATATNAFDHTLFVQSSQDGADTLADSGAQIPIRWIEVLGCGYLLRDFLDA